MTANAVSAVRRTTTILKALQLRLGRYRACRAGLTSEQLARHEARLESHGYIRLRDTTYTSWEEMNDACEADGWRYNPEMLDYPVLSSVEPPTITRGEKKTATGSYGDVYDQTVLCEGGAGGGGTRGVVSVGGRDVTSKQS